MKSVLKSLCFLAVILLANFVHADDGAGSTGGGDPLAQEFVKSGWMAYIALSNGIQFPGVTVDVPKLKLFLETTEVESTKKKVLFKGIDKCAKYDADKKHIMVNRKCFKKLTDTHKRRDLSLHEYLRAMGMNDNNYQISAKISAYIDMATQIYETDHELKDASKSEPVPPSVDQSRKSLSDLSKICGTYLGYIMSSDGRTSQVQLNLFPITTFASSPGELGGSILASVGGSLRICIENDNCFSSDGQMGAEYSMDLHFSAVKFDRASGKLFISSRGSDPRSLDLYLNATANSDVSVIKGTLSSAIKPNSGTIELTRVK